MIKLTTPVEVPTNLPKISHRHRLMVLGSCFATHIGNRLVEAKFNCDINPYGILYNPLSVSASLREIMEKKEYSEKDIFLFSGIWYSFMHHGEFSSNSAQETLQLINERIERAHNDIFELDYLLVTFGTAWVYEHKDTEKIVGNCHRKPDACFIRRRLSVSKIVEDYTSLITQLLAKNPKLKILFTVSPIRHSRDGMHENQLSKATLLLAIDRLRTAFPENIVYFPAYEMLVDELRDYRFYTEDMVHPSEIAVRYIWERFSCACFSEETLEIIRECERMCRALSHRPLRSRADEYKLFLEQTVLKIDELSRKYPYLVFQKERELCSTRLNIYTK